MEKIYFSLAGTRYYYGNEFLKKGVKLTLEKDPDNEYDKEAIAVKMKGMGTIGHVANSVRTVVGECYSAGRLYDKIGDKAKAKIVLVTPYGAICKVRKKDLLDYTPELSDIPVDGTGFLQ